MTMRTGGWFGLFGLAFVVVSCTPLPELPSATGDQLVKVPLPNTREVPAEFGRLVSVTHSPHWDNVFVLWFQNDEGAVHLVLYNSRTGALVSDAWIISRT